MGDPSLCKEVRAFLIYTSTLRLVKCLSTLTFVSRMARWTSSVNLTNLHSFHISSQITASVLNQLTQAWQTPVGSLTGTDKNHEECNNDGQLRYQTCAKNRRKTENLF